MEVKAAKDAGVEWALAVANRNFIIHQYDEINRELTWLTLSRDLVDLALRSSWRECPAAGAPRFAVIR